MYSGVYSHLNTFVNAKYVTPSGERDDGGLLHGLLLDEALLPLLLDEALQKGSKIRDGTGQGGTRWGRAQINVA